MKSLSGREFCRILERKGWTLLRVHGSHHVYSDKSGELRLSVPVHASETLKRGMQRRLMKDAGLKDGDL